jgi:hypothetical protein
MRDTGVEHEDLEHEVGLARAAELAEAAAV